MNENDFNKRFGSNSPLPPYNWSDDDYASGWNITGDMPPTRQQFDALQRTNDDKAAYLLDKIYSSARLLRRSTHYNKGDRVYAEGLKAGLYLECATAGMSGTDAIDFSSSKVGDTITDGGVTWTICKEIGTGNVPLVAGYNQKQTFTSSGSFTAPITGLYKIELQGGGGGGGNGTTTGDSNRPGYFSGSGGGEGANGVFYEKLIAGQTYNFTIGAGGAAQANGGDSSITLSKVYVAGGGVAGNFYGAGRGGSFTIDGTVINNFAGAAGSCGQYKPSNKYSATMGTECLSGSGGGKGGGQGSIWARGNVGVFYGVAGGGGAGGSISNGGAIMPGNGSAGGDGYITFEWFDPSLL